MKCCNKYCIAQTFLIFWTTFLDEVDRRNTDKLKARNINTVLGILTQGNFKQTLRNHPTCLLFSQPKVWSSNSLELKILTRFM